VSKIEEQYEEFMDAELAPESYPGDDVFVDYDAEIDGPDLALVDEDPVEGDVYAEGPLGQVEARRRWRIEDREGAAWAMRRYAAASEERDEIAALAQRMRDAADLYERQASVGAERDRRFFGGVLRIWHADKIRNAKTKTITFPEGDLTGRTGSVKAIVDDDVALLAWLNEHAPECVNVPEPPEPSPKLTEVKKLFGGKVDKKEPGEYPAVVDPDDPAVKKKIREAGEVVPGVKLVRGEPGFDIVLKGVE
jgi:hypothetical protein